MGERGRNEALMRRFYEELWSKGNLETIPELLAGAFVDHQAGQPRGREGPAGLDVMWRADFPDMRETVEALISEGDKVAGRSLMRGVDIVRIAGGKIAEFWYRERMPELTRQLRAAPGFDPVRAQGE